MFGLVLAVVFTSARAFIIPNHVQMKRAVTIRAKNSEVLRSQLQQAAMKQLTMKDIVKTTTVIVLRVVSATLLRLK